MTDRVAVFPDWQNVCQGASWASSSRATVALIASFARSAFTTVSRTLLVTLKAMRRMRLTGLLAQPLAAACGRNYDKPVWLCAGSAGRPAALGRRMG
jgi:hypothetical protein